MACLRVTEAGLPTGVGGGTQEACQPLAPFRAAGPGSAAPGLLEGSGPASWRVCCPRSPTSTGRQGWPWQPGSQRGGDESLIGVWGGAAPDAGCPQASDSPRCPHPPPAAQPLPTAGAGPARHTHATRTPHARGPLPRSPGSQGWAGGALGVGGSQGPFGRGDRGGHWPASSSRHVRGHMSRLCGGDQGGSRGAAPCIPAVHAFSCHCADSGSMSHSQRPRAVPGRQPHLATFRHAGKTPAQKGGPPGGTEAGPWGCSLGHGATGAGVVQPPTPGATGHGERWTLVQGRPASLAGVFLSPCGSVLLAGAPTGEEPEQEEAPHLSPDRVRVQPGAGSEQQVLVAICPDPTSLPLETAGRQRPWSDHVPDPKRGAGWV